MSKLKRTAAILVAAGRGLRAGSGGPKQYRWIGGQTVIFRAMEPFCRHPQIFAVQPVLTPDDTAIFTNAVSALRHEPPANGGATRQASVHAGLEALASRKPDVVLIHDAARPFVSAALISRAIDAAGRTGAAIPAIQVADTIKLIGDNGNVEATPERARLRIAQTPQAFRFDVILDAILGALADGDMGSHFPPSDPQWKGASSDRFLKYAADRVTARGGRIANLEVTLICERPKIGPLRDTMRARIAEITGLNVSRVAVKATTSERLGFTGRDEGIAATARATIPLPSDNQGRSDYHSRQQRHAPLP